MAVEARRGCGYRKAGGIYLVTGGGIGEPCERLPIPLAECPSCKHSPIELTRGFQWVGASYIFGQALPCHGGDTPEADHCLRCVLCNEKLMTEADPMDQFGLLSIGKEHYETPGEWTVEANKLGVSRRISGIPKGLVLGQTWILVAHPETLREKCPNMKPGLTEHVLVHDGEAKDCDLCKGQMEVFKPGIFHAFRPRALELVVTPSMKKQGWVKEMVEKHKVKLVEVPEDDPDHAPTVSKPSKRKKAMEKHARRLAPKKKAKKDEGKSAEAEE